GGQGGRATEGGGWTGWVGGGGEPPAGSGWSQRSRPVCLSKAWIRSSLVPAMNTRPPAVTIEPPKVSVPVRGIPRAVSSTYSPRGTRQANSPVLRLIAFRTPQGGLIAG